MTVSSNRQAIPGMGFIYGLLDPYNTWELRYVGQTIYPLKTRLSGHMTLVRKAAKASDYHNVCWIRSLKGAEPKIIQLGCYPRYLLDAAEKSAIADYKSKGHRLTNSRPGGPTARGWSQSPKAKAKIGKSLTGRRHTQESRTKMSESVTGRVRGPNPPWLNAKISAAQKGIPRPWQKGRLDEEWKANISAANRGRKLTSEHRKKLSEAKQGTKPGVRSSTLSKALEALVLREKGLTLREIGESFGKSDATIHEWLKKARTM